MQRRVQLTQASLALFQQTAGRAAVACFNARRSQRLLGALDKNEFTRAHLMHLANHWTETVRS